MRVYRVDALAETEISLINQRLHKNGFSAEIDGLFWLPVPEHLLTSLQIEHKGQCGPYVMALELMPDAVHLELLVRARNCLRCACIEYASPALQTYIINYLHSFFDDLGIHA